MNIERLETMVQFLCQRTTDEVFEHLKLWGFAVHHDLSLTKRYAVKHGTTLDRPLLVCHADTVLSSTAYSYDDITGTVVSSELDDRLGIAVMLCLLSDGIDVSCLVCDNEETGATTATQFAKESNLAPVWMTEFDRRGVDVVCYAYETPILCSLLEHCGLTIGQGSFSDISSLESLGVIGFNLGVGYHREHSLKCFANLHDTLRQVGLWLDWYHWLANVRLSHVPEPKYGTSTRYDAWEFHERYTSKILDNPRVDDWDGPSDDPDDLDGLESCECCECLTHPDDMTDFGAQRICDQCFADYISPRVR